MPTHARRLIGPPRDSLLIIAALMVVVGAGIVFGGQVAVPARDGSHQAPWSARSASASALDPSLGDWLTRAIDLQLDEFFVHIAPGSTEPRRVLVALHGMGGTGLDGCSGLLPYTDPAGWIVVAPTFQYGDWRDPIQVTAEAARQGPRIAAMLDQLPTLTGLAVDPRTFVYGFSRGGQAANRFSLLYPERVAAVALASSGTYTLPVATSPVDGGGLRFPYGVADFRQVFGRDFRSDAFQRIVFWIGVGDRDNDPSAVPHQWDAYLGSDRRERAERFGAVLSASGMQAVVRVFPGIGHEETDQTRRSAMEFLSQSS